MTEWKMHFKQTINLRKSFKPFRDFWTEFDFLPVDFIFLLRNEKGEVKLVIASRELDYGDTFSSSDLKSENFSECLFPRVIEDFKKRAEELYRQANIIIEALADKEQIEQEGNQVSHQQLVSETVRAISKKTH